MDCSRLTVDNVKSLKGKRKLTMLTAYDFPVARIVDEAGIDMILVGDSLANVVLGLDSTTKVGMNEMLIFAKAVTRAVKQALVIGDMPYESYQVNPEEAVKNARRFINEAGCGAIKLEWFDQCLKVTKEIIKEGIAVMGHIGLTPQTADRIGGFKVQGKDANAAKQLIDQAFSLQGAGCFALVLECVPERLAELITKKLNIPTIGIGAGSACDGQVLVIHDLLGLLQGFRPKFVKQYVNLHHYIKIAIEAYKKEVLEGNFPSKEHTFSIKEEELKKIK